ncbi:hypothetical protein D3C81_1753810 [compost metagenome]
MGSAVLRHRVDEGLDVGGSNIDHSNVVRKQMALQLVVLAGLDALAAFVCIDRFDGDQFGVQSRCEKMPGERGLANVA